MVKNEKHRLYFIEKFGCLYERRLACGLKRHTRQAHTTYTVLYKVYGRRSSEYNLVLLEKCGLFRVHMVWGLSGSEPDASQTSAWELGPFR